MEMGKTQPAGKLRIQDVIGAIMPINAARILPGLHNRIVNPNYKHGKHNIINIK